MSDPNVLLLSPDATLEGYDRWSARYDRDDNPMVAATAWALDQRPFDVSGARVVEFGCGTGRHAAPALAAGARAYLGIDGSPGMLAVARAANADPRCTWLHSALDAIPSLGEPFDAALIVLVLEHVADLAPLFWPPPQRSGSAAPCASSRSTPTSSPETVAHFRDDAGQGPLHELRPSRRARHRPHRRRLRHRAARRAHRIRRTARPRPAPGQAPRSPRPRRPHRPPDALLNAPTRGRRWGLDKR